MLDKLFTVFSKVPKGLSLQLKFRKNKNGQEMLYVYLSGSVNDHWVKYERQMSLKNAVEVEADIVRDLIKAAFNDKSKSEHD